MHVSVTWLKPVAVGLIVPIILLLTWQVLGSAGVISPLLFPRPSVILEDFWKLLTKGDLLSHINISIVRTLTGFALGGGLGLLAGLFVGLFNSIERIVDPTLQMIRMIPHLAVTALFILWFGIGETSKILLIAKGAFFPLYINLYLGIRNADNKLFDVARILSFGFIKRTVLLVLPSALPNLFLGIRLSLGVAWLSLVVAELLGSTEGIGYLMMDARMLGRTSTVFVGIFLFAVIGKIADSLVLAIEKRALRWNNSYKGD